MYINTYNTYENFKGIAINTESKEIISLNSFLDLLTKYFTIYDVDFPAPIINMFLIYIK